MYFALRPYTGTWQGLVSVYIPAVVFGAVAGPAACEYVAIKSILLHLLSAFLLAMLAMPINRLTLATTEKVTSSDVVSWVKERFLGIKRSDTAEGGNRDDTKP